MLLLLFCDFLKRTGLRFRRRHEDNIAIFLTCKQAKSARLLRQITVLDAIDHHIVEHVVELHGMRVTGSIVAPLHPDLRVLGQLMLRQGARSPMDGQLMLLAGRELLATEL